MHYYIDDIANYCYGRAATYEKPSSCCSGCKCVVPPYAVSCLMFLGLVGVAYIFISVLVLVDETEY